MENTREKDTVSHNPYVVRIDKFADVLKNLSQIFLHLEGARSSFSHEEVEEIYAQVQEKVCKGCSGRADCLGVHQLQTHQLIYEVLQTVEKFGADLSTEMSRKLAKRCMRPEEFRRETLEAFQNAKQTLLWNNRLVQHREGCARQLDAFADAVSDAAKEIGDSIFVDEHLEKKLKVRLKKIGIRMLSSVFFVNARGRYEIHVTVKAMREQCVTTKELVKVVSECTGRNMVPEADERPILGNEYCTVICMEGASYYTLRGVAKLGKGCDRISGDSFLMMELPGGKEGAVLSDGMGSGEKAFQESARVVEMLEEMLAAGFPHKMALKLLNTALLIGREEIRFSTIDMSIFDMYTGQCEFVKTGASTTFIKYAGGKERRVERIVSSSLPLGVLENLEVESCTRQLSSGDVVVMMTDGVMDALPVGEQDVLMETLIQGTEINNPREMAHHILEQVLEFTGELPLDDMTVLVIGIWKA